MMRFRFFIFTLLAHFSLFAAISYSDTTSDLYGKGRATFDGSGATGLHVSGESDTTSGVYGGSTGGSGLNSGGDRDTTSKYPYGPTSLDSYSNRPKIEEDKKPQKKEAKEYCPEPAGDYSMPSGAGNFFGVVGSVVGGLLGMGATALAINGNIVASIVLGVLGAVILAGSILFFIQLHKADKCRDS